MGPSVVGHAGEWVRRGLGGAGGFSGEGWIHWDWSGQGGECRTGVVICGIFLISLVLGGNKVVFLCSKTVN